jgi:hypothetical protein
MSECNLTIELTKSKAFHSGKYFYLGLILVGIGSQSTQIGQLRNLTQLERGRLNLSVNVCQL